MAVDGNERAQARARLRTVGLSGLQAMYAMGIILHADYARRQVADVLDEIGIQADGLPRDARTVNRWEEAVGFARGWAPPRTRFRIKPGGGGMVPAGHREHQRRIAAARAYLATVRLDGVQALAAMRNFMRAAYAALDVDLILGEIAMQRDALPMDPHTLIGWHEGVEKALASGLGPELEE